MTSTESSAVQVAHTAIEQDVFCQSCGYDLRGLTGDRCPECGADISGVHTLVTRIPWVYRHEIGRVRAYCQTLWLVMFCQRKFGEEMARSVSWEDAQRFRWVTVGFLTVSILAAVVAAYLNVPSNPFQGELANQSYMAIWPACGCYLIILLFLIVATAIPSYFFHPRDVPVIQQNRAVALSYYACGPLVLLGVSCLSLAIALLPKIGESMLGVPFTFAAVGLPIGAVVPWWLDLIHLCRRLLPQRPGRAIALALLVPILWISSGAALLLGIWFVGLFIVVVANSFV